VQISSIPFVVTDWSQVERTEHKGERGMAYWRTRDFGGIGVRMVEYTPGYVAESLVCKGPHTLLHGRPTRHPTERRSEVHA
jgi:hypothetical protein